MTHSNFTQALDMTGRDGKRSGERGFSIVALLIFFAVVMVIGIGAAQIRVSAMRGQEQQAIKLNEKWRARSGASVVSASLRNQLPPQYASDIAAGRALSGTNLLPSFDDTTVAPANSRPLMTVNPTTGTLTATGTPPGSATSLLGQPEVWGNARLRIAENYAATQGYGADVVNVVTIREATRIPTGGNEDSYVLEYIVDGKGSEYRTRPRGEIVLGPNSLQCGTLVTISANPTTIIRGNSTTISVNYTRAKVLTLKNAAGTVIQQRTVAEEFTSRTATFTVSPRANETYRVEAQGGGSCSAISGPLVITVTDPPCPSITLYNANPTSVEPGAPSFIQWNVLDATDVRINGVLVPSSGSMTVTPAATQDYTLTAEGFEGWCPQTATVRVTVLPCPSIQYFDTLTPSITRGSDATVRWNILNWRAGVTVTLDGVPVAAPSGTYTFTQPDATATHILRISGPGTCAPSQQSVTITVNNRPCPQIINFFANPTSVIIDDDTILGWDIANFLANSSATLSFNGTTQGVGATGSLPFTMRSAGSFPGTLTVTSTYPECSTPQVSNVTVLVSTPPGGSCPVISNLRPSSNCVAPGTPVTIFWDRTGQNTGVTVTINGAGNYTNVNSATFTVNSPQTFTVSASRNGCPVSSQSVSIDVAQPTPQILSYSATNTNPPAATPVTVAWDTTGAVSGDINGSPIALPASNLTFTPNGPTDLLLTLRSGGCSPQVTQQNLHIQPQPPSCPQPIINGFSATPPSVPSGSPTNLSWAISNLEPGAVMQLTGPGVNLSIPASGSQSIMPPAAPGQYAYTVSAYNPCNPAAVVQQTVLVTVTTCPAVAFLSFTATPNSVTAGQNNLVRLQWQVSDPGATVSISPGVGGGLPATGFVDIPQPAGTTTFTAVASNSCGMSGTAQTTVTVGTPPTTKTQTTQLGRNGGSSCRTTNLVRAMAGLPPSNCTEYSATTTSQLTNNGGNQFTLTSTLASNATNQYYPPYILVWGADGSAGTFCDDTWNYYQCDPTGRNRSPLAIYDPLSSFNNFGNITYAGNNGQATFVINVPGATGVLIKHVASWQVHDDFCEPEGGCIVGDFRYFWENQSFNGKAAIPQDNFDIP